MEFVFYSVSVNGKVVVQTILANSFMDAKREFDQVWFEHGRILSVVNMINNDWNANLLIHSKYYGTVVNAASYMYSNLVTKDGNFLDCEKSPPEEALRMVNNVGFNNLLCIKDKYRVKYKRKEIPLSDWKLFTMYLTCMEAVRHKAESSQIVPYVTYASEIGGSLDYEINSARNLAALRLLLIENRGLMLITMDFDTFKEKALASPEIHRLLQ